ncbi:hypothetical protein BGZ54_009398 [Gamsiella multidivaricata]|nr:hypothetical protein BGZ54_009398 [Gamsiella multidivaricata]
MSDLKELRESTPNPIGPSPPGSPMPMLTSKTEKYLPMADCTATTRCEGGDPREPSRRRIDSQPAHNEGLLNDVMYVNNASASSSGVQNRTKSQETVRTLHDHPSHRVHSAGDIQELEEWVRADAQDQGDQKGSEVQKSGWNQEETEEQEQSEQRTKGEPQACLFVASLAASRTDVQLVDSVTEHFKKWGSLLNVKVMRDWMQRPYSFVQFEHIEDAEKAMADAQNTVIDGRHIRIEQARVNRTLFILKFGRATTEQDLIDMLEQYGPIEDVSIFHDLGPARNRRYAFAKFAYRDDAIRAYMALRNGSKWTVEWAPNLSTQNQVEKESVFVGQLNPELTTEAVLHDRFKSYGNIQYLHLVKRNKPGTNRLTAFAFIEFDDEQSAKRAIDNENNAVFLGTTIRVQHREASEYRQQRQSAATQAARSLNVPHSMAGPPPMGISAPPVHVPEYNEGYQPYRAPGMERPMYYTTYYAYPAPGMPMTAPGFVSRPPSGPMFVQPGGIHRRTVANHDGNQPHYQGMAAYAVQTSNPGTSSNPYELIQETGPGQQRCDYMGYVHSQGGICYPSVVPARVYMYDQGPAMAAVASVGPAAASVTPTAASVPATPPIAPIWYTPSWNPGNPPRVGSQEASANSQAHYAMPVQGRPPNPSSPTTQNSSSLDSRSQAHRQA